MDSTQSKTLSVTISIDRHTSTFYMNWTSIAKRNWIKSLYGAGRAANFKVKQVYNNFANKSLCS